MKYLFIILLFLNTVQASQTSIYETSLYTGTVFLFLLLLAIAIVQMRKNSQDRQILKEKEEKITWLRQIYAEKEHNHLQDVQKMEKEILKLTHSNENLELRLKEGTKNQVVNKIEELQNKRQTVQSRLATQL
jgi:Na+-transporting methylmalonyl-CoA/oxaloacetate decarboxylase gamma subunit